MRRLLGSDAAHRPTDPTAGVEEDLLAAERAGLRLAVIGRNAALVPLAVWMLVGGNPPYNLYGVAVVCGFLVLGLAYLRLLASGHERRWHRFAFVGGDVAALAAAALFVPVSFGDDVPQIFVFRGFGVGVMFLVIAAASLSLMPSLVLWAGVATSLGLWFVYAVIISGMEQTVSWSDLPPAPSIDEFYAVVLSPDFVGQGNRVTETLGLLSVAGLVALAVARAREVVRARAIADEQRLRAIEVFGQYVPPAIVTALVETPESIAPQIREATILFADVEGFTRYSEARPPEAVLGALSGLFTRVAAIVVAEGGVVVGFAGDAVLAAFNLPLEREGHAAAALAAGNAIVASADPDLPIRVGIATGRVAAGTVGGSDRQAYTVYGDTVNVAQRLEALNKQHGTRLLADAATWEAAGRPEGYREMGTVELRNRTLPSQVFTRT